MKSNSPALKTYYKMSVRQSEIGDWLREFEEELKAKNLPQKIRYCFGDEWYYIEGSNVIVIPFYLHSLKFANYLKRKSCHVEGLTKKSFLMLLRHEYGHYFECLFQTRKKAERRKLFGKNIKYPKSYLPKEVKNEFVSHLPNQYAQSHPDEDFAESFAVVFKSEAWQKKYPKNSVVFRKLNYVSKLIHSHKNLKKRNLVSGEIYLPKQNYRLDRWIKENQKPKTRAFAQSQKQQIKNFLSTQNYPSFESKRLIEALKLAANEKRQTNTNLKSFMKPESLSLEIKRIRRKKAHYISM
ncbi:MAG: hypothetical protein CL674_05555 [Bdellovibrionaceae bacterium]|nr:hypothetical protein [Pseudobdellovibrionaceae bacterium]|tara:strand:+ start:79474 stop:80361 length:888 start_codon:yes stop_codon:yes gene_type:complete